MYYKDLLSFFKSVIGYDGAEWWTLGSVRWQGNPPWLSHDMEKMLENQVGYPSLLHLFVIISFLGYCANPNRHASITHRPSERPGNDKDFDYFCHEYLGGIYDDKKRFLWECVRGKLAHLYFTKNAITTQESEDHMRIGNMGPEKPYLFISVKNFWKDTQKAIESLYKNIGSDYNKKEEFLEKLDNLDTELWIMNKRYLESGTPANTTREQSQTGPSGPNMPDIS